MFTTMFQIFLFICVSGLVTIAISTWLNDNREERATARENAAHAYANSVVRERMDNGYYTHRTLQDVKNDFDNACARYFKLSEF